MVWAQRAGRLPIPEGVAAALAPRLRQFGVSDLDSAGFHVYGDVLVLVSDLQQDSFDPAVRHRAGQPPRPCGLLAIMDRVTHMWCQQPQVAISASYNAYSGLIIAIDRQLNIACMPRSEVEQRVYRVRNADLRPA